MHTFAIIGTGGIAKTHALAIKSIEGAVLKACYNRDSAKAEAFADKHGIQCYTDLESLFSDPGIENIVITTASGAHLDYALAAIEHGRNVVIEKPLEVTSARCQQIIAAAEKKGVKTCVIFQNRFSDAAVSMKKAMDKGRFGRSVYISAYLKCYRTQAYYDSAAWRGTMALDGGGALMNQGIHSVDLLEYVAGPVREVMAFTGTLTHEGIEVEDTVAAALRYESGALGVIEASTSVYPGFSRRLEINGSEGSAVLEDDTITCWNFRSEDAEMDSFVKEHCMKGESAFNSAASPEVDYVLHRKQYLSFISSLDNGTPISPDAVEGERSVRIVEAVYDSATFGRLVKIEE